LCLIIGLTILADVLLFAGAPKRLNECVMMVVGKNMKNYSTCYSQVVSHPSTKHASARLTSEIERVPVNSRVYGHSCEVRIKIEFDDNDDDAR